MAAHECARYAAKHGVSSDWLELAPSFLIHSLRTDCKQVLAN